MTIECKKCIYFNDKNNEYNRTICAQNPVAPLIVDYDDACLNFMPNDLEDQVFYPKPRNDYF